MKKLTSFLICILFVTSGLYAADPFRTHRYDVFKVLPLSEQNIVFVGNSITNMHEWWEAFGSDGNIVNRGVWGTFIDETVSHIEAVAMGKPKKVFFMVGTNDLGKNGSRNINDIIENTRIMVERLQRVSPTTEIYIQGILPSVYNRVLEQLEETNVRLKELCSQYGVTYIDLWNDLFSLTQDNTHTLDGLHMKASGYHIWTKKIQDYVGAKTVYPDNCTAVQSYNGISNASYAMRATIFSMLPVNEGDILIIGDEMIHGGEWHELLKSNRVKSRGSGWGYTGPGLDVMLKEIPLILNTRGGSCKPSKVLLYAGAAEINGTASLSTIEGSYRNVIAKIKECAPDVTVCLMSLQPTTSASTNMGRVVPFNNLLKAIADADEKIEYIDIYTGFEKNNVAGSDFFSGNYLNGFGYVKVAQRIADALPDEALVALTDEEARCNYRTFELRTALGDALVVAAKLEEGDGAGEYSASALAALNALVDNAYSMLRDGATEEEYTAMAAQITTAAQSALKGINKPQLSNGNNEYWYKLSTPNRGNRYLTSNGAGVAAIGDEANNWAKSQWKFVPRNDGTVDIVNRGNGTFLNPNSAYNSAINTTSQQPAKGWTFDYCNAPGLYIINSGTVQLNQTQSDLGWKIYNWSSRSDGCDRDDKGCQYRIELVVEEPDEVVVEPCIAFSFSRGSSLANTFVTVRDGAGNSVDGVSAEIIASGANSWLVSNSAAGDSILCLNVNTNATSAASPITYLLEIDGLDDGYSFHSVQFRSVALNSAGNWQGATETRHCNFICSYGSDKESMTELAPITDESIMVGGGVPKNVDFELGDISSSGGKLIIELQIYKGTNNNGCFYGLTGIVLKGKFGEETTVIDIATDVHRGVAYDLTGRKVSAPDKGIYIVDGVKRVVK
ncbi:MAG: hypothetical protein IKY19_08715 [Bacteroidaceae bacterium]|nr:hypothetical protein [Bacteroidaceae bacterium]